MKLVILFFPTEVIWYQLPLSLALPFDKVNKQVQHQNK